MESRGELTPLLGSLCSESTSVEQSASSSYVASFEAQVREEKGVLESFVREPGKTT